VVTNRKVKLELFRGVEVNDGLAVNRNSD